MGKRKSSIVLPLIIICLVGLCCGMNIRWLGDKPVLAIETDDYGFNSVAYSPDGDHVATVYTTAYASIYDIESGDEILQLDGYLSAPSYSPDGNYIAALDLTDYPLRAIRIWDARTGEELSMIKTQAGHPDFHPDSNQLLANNGYTGDIEVWDVATGELVLNIEEAYAQSARYSSDGKKIVAGCRDGLICVWDASTGEELLEIVANESGLTDLQVLISPDGSYIAGLDIGAHSIQLWDASSGEKLGRLRDLRVLSITEFAISPGGKYIAGLGTFGHLVIWNTNTRLPVRFYAGLLTESRDGYATSVEFSPTGDTFAVTGDDELQVILGNWD